MPESKVFLAVGATSEAKADSLTAELQQYIRERTDIEVSRSRGDPETMDGGATLVAIVVTSKAVVELSKGVADWMRKRNLAVNVGAGRGSIRVEGPASHVERVIREVLKSQKQS
jgi:hypothetical protein